MAKRYIGDARIRIEWSDVDNAYKGAITVDEPQPDGVVRTYVWLFDDLKDSLHGQATQACDSPETYDRMASSAVGFGTYYISTNRGEDAPQWAPTPETADAIERATSYSFNGGKYNVRRKAPRKRGSQ
jgi:hypothetical protein